MHMARIRLTEVGWKTPLAFEEGLTPLPIPTGEEVLVQVDACGICHRDLIDRAGRIPFMQVPITPGHEAAGHVVAVGDAVTDWRVGDRVGSMHRDACGECPQCKKGETSLCNSATWVLGLLADGGYSSHLLMPQSGLYRLPESTGEGSLSAAEAAVLHCTFGTAFRDLKTLGGIQSGERVLITGANGGVGLAGVQLAVALGAEVIAVVRSEEHIAFIKNLGAHHVVVDAGSSFSSHDSVGRVDLALDTVGVSTFLSSLRSLRLGGRLVVVGNIVPEKVSLNLGYIITNGLHIIGGSGATRNDMAQVLELHRTHPFHIPIARTLPLAHAEEGQRLVQGGGLQGRVVLMANPG